MRTKIRQRDATDCGAACLASVAAYYKVGLPVSKIRQLAGTDREGTTAWGLIKAAEKMGFSAKGVKGGPDSLCAVDCPAIAHVVLENKLLHFVVIFSTQSGTVKYMDPADGDFRTKSYPEFQRMWSGVLILVAPGPDFKPRNDRIPLLRRFIFLVRPQRGMMLLAMAGAVIYTVTGLAFSVYIQKLTDLVLIEKDISILNIMGIVMLSVLVFQLYVGFTKNLLVLETGQRIDARLIMGYYRHLLNLPQAFFDTMRTGEIISRIDDAVKIRAFINDTATTLLVSLLIVLFSLLLMAFHSLKLTAIVLATLPVYILIYLATDSVNKKRERKLMEHSAELENQLVESLSFARTIKLFGLEEHAGFRTEARFSCLIHSIFHSARNSLVSSAGTDLVSQASTVVLLWTGAGFVLNQSLTPGELLSFYALSAFLTGPVSNLIIMNKTIQNALIAADRLFEIMDLEPESETHHRVPVPGMIPGIEFRQVNFGYGARPAILNGLNLTIREGEITGLAGESGSGKTTIISLVMKLYPVTSGSILIGGKNVDDHSTKALRKIIGVIPQQVDLFAGTIAENIALGEPQPDMQKILQICDDLRMAPMIDKLPAGLNSLVGEQGTGLSGGEKQKIAIARALYRDPEILLFDEATSSLDNESEYYVRNTIRYLKKKGKTVLIIAHRLSTLVFADHIAVLDKGSVAECGTHEELWQLKGKYYRMWQRQMPFNTGDEIAPISPDHLASYRYEKE